MKNLYRLRKFKTIIAPHSTSFLGITLLQASHPKIRSLRRKYGNARSHGNKIWRTSLVMMDFLSDTPHYRNTPILDVGCGWGAVSLLLTKQYQAKVTALDIDPLMEFILQVHCEINGCTVEFITKDLDSLGTEELAKYQIVVGTDICFWDSTVDKNFKLVKRAMEAGCQEFLIADPGRPPFWDLVDQCNDSFYTEVKGRNIYHDYKSWGYVLKITPI